MSKVRGIDNIDEFLNPSSKNVLSPFTMRNITQAIERIKIAVDNKEKIVVDADIDPDGCSATVIMVQYLQELDANVSFIFHQRSKGHGVEYSDVPNDTDLLLILDSSSSSVNRCRELNETMDIIIIDHHNIEAENPYCILVNINHPECPYENKDLSATGVVWKVIEALDYHYRKVNVRKYLDLVSLSLLSDSMRVNGLENRWILKEGFKKTTNVGLLALIKATRSEKVNSQTLSYNVIPVLNTATRDDEIYKVFSLLFEKDYFKALEKAKFMVNSNKNRKERVKNLVEQYRPYIQDEKFIYCVSDFGEKGYNGLVAQKLSSEFRKPSFTLISDGEYYQGSYRTYNDFDVQSFVKKFPYTELAAGHAGAGGFKIKAENWNKFKQYVNDNIDEKLFDPVIEYDIELSENDLSWDLVNEIESFNEIWGNGNPPISVRLNDVFVEGRELFPQKKPEHVKIKTDIVDMLAFNDSEYAKDISSWDYISCVGSLSINDYDKNNKRIQFFIEDYKKR